MDKCQWTTRGFRHTAECDRRAAETVPTWRKRAADPIGQGATMLRGKDLTGAVRA